MCLLKHERSLALANPPCCVLRVAGASHRPARCARADAARFLLSSLGRASCHSRLPWACLLLWASDGAHLWLTLSSLESAGWLS